MAEPVEEKPVEEKKEEKKEEAPAEEKKEKKAKGKAKGKGKASEKGGRKGLLPTGLKWVGRTETTSVDKAAGIFGGILVLGQIIVSLFIVANSNGFYDPRAATDRTCPTGYTHWQYLCVKEALIDEKPPNCDSAAPEVIIKGTREMMEEVLAGETASRRLHFQTAGFDALANGFLAATDPITRRLNTMEDASMWDMATQHAEVIGVLSGICIFGGLLWVFLLQRIPKVCIYAGIFVGCGLCIFMSIFPMFVTVTTCVASWQRFTVSNDMMGELWCAEKDGRIETATGEFAWQFLIPGICAMLCTFYWRKRVTIGAACLKKCCMPLRESKSISMAALALFGGFMVYNGIWIAFALNVSLNFQWWCVTTGEPIIAPRNNRDTVLIMSVALVITYVYLEMMLTVVVSCGVGGWYFPKAKGTPKLPAFAAMKWIVSSSSGPIILATFISWPIVEIRGIVNSWISKFKYLPILPCAWVYYFYYLFWCLAVRPYFYFTRFMVISHTFHGGDILTVCHVAWKVLKKHIGGSAVTDPIASTVLYTFVTLLSIGFACLAWAWMESLTGKGYLADIMQGNGDPIYCTILAVTIVLWSKHSLCTVVIVSLCAGYAKKSVLGDWAEDLHGFMIGIFAGALCNIIFSYLSKYIQATVDTVLYCFALEQENGESQKRLADMDQFIKDSLVIPIPEFVIAGEKEIASMQAGSKQSA